MSNDMTLIFPVGLLSIDFMNAPFAMYSMVSAIGNTTDFSKGQLSNFKLMLAFDMIMIESK